MLVCKSVWSLKNKIKTNSFNFSKVRNPGSHRTYHWTPKNRFQNGTKLSSRRNRITNQCFYGSNGLEFEENDGNPKGKHQKLFFGNLVSIQNQPENYKTQCLETW